jgi:hypothetical protein
MAAGRLTEAEIAALHVSLVRIAFNMTAVGQNGPVPARAAAYWLFHVRPHRLALLPAASSDELEGAAPSWRAALARARHGTGARANARAPCRFVPRLVQVRRARLTLLTGASIITSTIEYRRNDARLLDEKSGEG